MILKNPLYQNIDLPPTVEKFAELISTRPVTLLEADDMASVEISSADSVDIVDVVQ